MVKKNNVEKIKNNLIELKKKVEDIESNFENNSEKFGEQTKIKIIKTKNQIKENIEEHPLQSVGIAFGAGVIMGLITFTMLRKK